MDIHNDTIKASKNEITQFIQQQITNTQIRNTYLNGKCRIFAHILKKNYNGIIYFLPDYFHFVFCKDNKLYDASGNVTNKYKLTKKIREKDVPEKILTQYT